MRECGFGFVVGAVCMFAGVIVCLFGLDALFGLGLVTCGVLVWSWLLLGVCMYD